MPRLGFGAFLAPHHPVGENPLLQFRRDLDLVEHLDKLGYDEFWCGEHHSSGWEMIGSPEMFLAAAAERSKRIKLATGVVSLPYHHPFNVAQRMVQLDWMSSGRAIFGSGPGALASDAHTLGIDPMVQRDQQDEAIGVIRRLMRGERVSEPDAALEKTAVGEVAAATSVTPDDLVARIKSVLEVSGGFGTLVGFVHDWANPENTFRSWDLVARYVVPEINGYLAGLRQSQHFVATNRGVFDRAKEAIMAKITENEAALAALAVTRGSRLGDVASASNIPDLDKARARAKAR